MNTNDDNVETSNDDDDDKTVATSNSNTRHDHRHHKDNNTTNECTMTKYSTNDNVENGKNLLLRTAPSSILTAQIDQRYRGDRSQVNMNSVGLDTKVTFQQGQGDQESDWEQQRGNDDVRLIIDSKMERNLYHNPSKTTIPDLDHERDIDTIVPWTTLYTMLTSVIQQKYEDTPVVMDSSHTDNYWKYFSRSNSTSSTETSRSASPLNSNNHDANGIFENYHRTNSMSLLSTYRHFVSQHYNTLLQIDDTISRILFWIPYSSTTRIIWGLLELNRLCMNITLQQQKGPDSNSCHNPYGMSIVSGYNNNNNMKESELSSIVSPPHGTNIRFGLTVIQSLLPILQEITTIITMRNFTDLDKDDAAHEHNQSKLRCYVERVRLLLRFTLLSSYWYDIHKHQSSPRQASPTRIIVPGIMLNGGQYHHSDESLMSLPHSQAPTIRQEQKRMERLGYIGKRTGRRIAPTTFHPSDRSLTTVIENDHRSHLNITNETTNQIVHSEQQQDTTVSSRLSTLFQSIRDCVMMMKTTTTIVLGSTVSTNTMMRMKQIKMLLGELLYIIRPWIQAEIHQKIYHQMSSNNIPNYTRRRPTSASNATHYSPRTQLLFTWILGLGMDLISLKLLQNERNNSRTITTQSNRSNVSCRDGGDHYQQQGINQVEMQEIKRRKLRLMLYVLRCPIYDMYTKPSIETVTSIIETCIPYFGRMFLTNSIWDLIYYWKYYRLEEG